MGYPCNFRCKTFYMVFLFLEQTFRNKHWHINIFNTCCLETFIQFMLDIFPDRITCRFNCHATFNACITNQTCFDNNVCIPLRKIFAHGCNLTNLLLFFCHFYSLLYLIFYDTPIGATSVSYCLFDSKRGSTLCCSRKHFPLSIPSTASHRLNRDQNSFGGTTLFEVFLLL